MRATVGNMPGRLATAAALALLGAAASRPSAAAVRLHVADLTLEAGGSGEVIVSLDGGGAAVAGMQNDLVLPAGVRPLRRPDGRLACAAAPATGKDVYTGLDDYCERLEPCEMRALVLSLADIDPIPDGELYRCTVEADRDLPEVSGRLIVNDAGASDPEGNALDVVAESARFEVRGARRTAFLRVGYGRAASGAYGYGLRVVAGPEDLERVAATLTMTSPVRFARAADGRPRCEAGEGVTASYAFSGGPCEDCAVRLEAARQGATWPGIAVACVIDLTATERDQLYPIACSDPAAQLRDGAAPYATCDDGAVSTFVLRPNGEGSPLATPTPTPTVDPAPPNEAVVDGGRSGDGCQVGPAGAAWLPGASIPLALAFMLRRGRRRAPERR